MDLKQLEYFLAVAEERSVTRAAARLEDGADAVAAHVRERRAELGADLPAARAVAETAPGLSDEVLTVNRSQLTQP